MENEFYQYWTYFILTAIHNGSVNKMLLDIDYGIKKLNNKK